MDFNELQNQVKEWGLYNFPDSEEWMPLVGAVEEIGELCHAHLKEKQKIRLQDFGDFREAKEDAIGDTIIFLTDYCNRNNLNLEHCIKVAWNIVSARDWRKFPNNGIDK